MTGASAEVAWSPNASHLALSGEADKGVSVLDIESGVLTNLTDTESSGYAFAWSHDGSKLGFKILHRTPQGFDQEPVVYDVATNTVRSLAAPSPLAGIPSFSATGDTAFTIDRHLVVVRADATVQRYDLGQYVNLVKLSPCGTKVAYGDDAGNVWVRELATGIGWIIAREASVVRDWSPDGSRVLLEGIAGAVYSARADREELTLLGKGVSPVWISGGNRVMYTEISDPQANGKPVTMSVQAVRYDGTGREVLTGISGHDARISPDGRRLVYRGQWQGQLRIAHEVTARRAGQDGGRQEALSVRFSSNRSRLLNEVVKSYRRANEASYPHAIGEILRPFPADRSTPVKIEGVPYIHQVYDTPNHFNGHWACGATSAAMTLAYYKILKHWDTTVDVPSPHVSHWGNYVSEQYSFGDTTFNIGSPDASGRTAYGGYGYIVRNDWEETRGYMRDYIRIHGPKSETDWSPTWDEFKADINNKNPFVVLNMLTSAGHYIVAVGYYTDQHTGVFNDPYGDRNKPSYPNTTGTGVLYDWPGFNNGYRNLSTVSCLIWSRSTVQEPPPEPKPEPQPEPKPEVGPESQPEPVPDSGTDALPLADARADTKEAAPPGPITPKSDANGTDTLLSSSDNEQDNYEGSCSCMLVGQPATQGFAGIAALLALLGIAVRRSKSL